MNESTVTDISKIRRFLYDASFDGCVVSEIIELPPVSDEVAEKEHADSERRIDGIKFLFEELDEFATVQARIFMVLTGLCEHQEHAEAMYKVFYDCALGSMLAVLTTLKDSGKIRMVA